MTVCTSQRNYATYVAPPPQFNEYNETNKTQHAIHTCLSITGHRRKLEGIGCLY